MRKTAQEIITEWYETGNVALLSPNIEWHVLSTFPSGGLYIGIVAVTSQFFPSIKARFAKYETIPEGFVSYGNDVVSRGKYRVTSFTSETVESEFAHFWTVEGGFITSFRQVADTAAISSIGQAA